MEEERRQLRRRRRLERLICGNIFGSVHGLERRRDDNDEVSFGNLAPNVSRFFGREISG